VGCLPHPPPFDILLTFLSLFSLPTATTPPGPLTPVAHVRRYHLPGMTNDIPADVATGSDPKEPTPPTKTAARTTRAAAQKATKSARNKAKTSTKAGTKAGTKATQEDPGEESSSSDTSSSSSADGGGTDQSSSDHKEDQPSITPLGRGRTPFPPKGTKERLELPLRKHSKSRGHTDTTTRAPLLSGTPTATELCAAARPGPVKRPRLCTLRLPSWDSSSTGATTSSRAIRILTRRRESTLRKSGRTPSVFTSTCWRVLTLLTAYMETPNHKCCNFGVRQLMVPRDGPRRSSCPQSLRSREMATSLTVWRI
jgi:hypothetical protein